LPEYWGSVAKRTGLVAGRQVAALAGMRSALPLPADAATTTTITTTSTSSDVGAVATSVDGSLPFPGAGF